jgi:hypothetical protein
MTRLSNLSQRIDPCAGRREIRVCHPAPYDELELRRQTAAEADEDQAPLKGASRARISSQAPTPERSQRWGLGQDTQAGMSWSGAALPVKANHGSI